LPRSWSFLSMTELSTQRYTRTIQSTGVPTAQAGSAKKASESSRMCRWRNT
jgi:hypothetical protein